MLLTTLREEWGVPGDVLKSGTCLSTMRHIDCLHTPLLFAYGTNGSSEFQRHSNEFAQDLQQAGLSCTLLVLQNLNHFEAIGSMTDQHSMMATTSPQQTDTCEIAQIAIGENVA